MGDVVHLVDSSGRHSPRAVCRAILDRSRERMGELLRLLELHREIASILAEEAGRTRAEFDRWTKLAEDAARSLATARRLEREREDAA